MAQTFLSAIPLQCLGIQVQKVEMMKRKLLVVVVVQPTVDADYYPEMSALDMRLK